MTKGLNNLKELAVKQRENLADSAAHSKVGIAAETRVRKISNSGEIKIRFTQPMKIPADAETRIK